MPLKRRGAGPGDGHHEITEHHIIVLALTLDALDGSWPGVRDVHLQLPKQPRHRVENPRIVVYDQDSPLGRRRGDPAREMSRNGSGSTLRKNYRDLGSGLPTGIEEDPALVLSDDALAHVEAEPRTGAEGLGRKERAEGPARNLGRHPHAVVFDDDLHVSAPCAGSNLEPALPMR